MPDGLAPAAFVFWGAFVVAILVVLAIVLGRRHLARRLRETGEALGLSYRRRSSITGYRAAFSHVIEGEIDGVKVESFHAKLNVGYDPLINRSGRQPFTYVRAVFNPPLGIGLRATTAGGFDGLLGRAEGEDVPIDEQGFRGVFRVTARDGSRARFLLGPEIIREMMKLNEIYAGVALADELVQIKMSGYQIETELLRSAFADATGLANRIRGSQNSER